MENINVLGNLVSAHEENKTAMTTNLLVGLACLALAPFMVWLFLGEEGITFNKVLFGFSAVCMTIAAASVIWSYIKNRGGRVEIFENGLTIEKGGVKQTALWSEIAVVTEKVEKMYMNNQYIYDRYSYVIEKQNGETFQLSNLVSNIDRIGRQIKVKTFEHLYPQMTAKIERGEPVLFDSLAIDKNGISGVPWSNFSALELKEGMIEVKDRAGKPLVSGAYGATPNAHLLIALIRERLPLEE
ncbi:MAG TPA: DUF6585 family protein [Pyrinomonadaceae bacterium]|jgi:hypothetical protein